jgi:hypothetical protein
LGESFLLLCFHPPPVVFRFTVLVEQDQTILGQFQDRFINVVAYHAEDHLDLGFRLAANGLLFQMTVFKRRRSPSASSHMSLLRRSRCYVPLLDIGSGYVLCLCLLVLAAAVKADVFNMGGTRNPATGTWTGLASHEFVPVGDAGSGELQDRLPTAF